MLDRVSKAYGKRTVVDAVSLEVREGELLALLGPSGSGKSTILAMIAGLVVPDAGTIRLGGRVVNDPRIRVPARGRNIGMVFQEQALWPHLSVRDHLTFVAPRVDPTEILEALELTPRARARPATLSGGEAQRLAIARALVRRPSTFLLDEPLGSLDRCLKERLLFRIVELHRKFETTSIYVTHDYEEAFRVADRVAIMIGGRIAQVGAPQEVYDRPLTEEIARLTGPVSAWRGGWIRPERLLLRSDPGGPGQVVSARRLGAHWEIEVYLEGSRVTAFAPESLSGRVAVTVQPS